MDIVGGSRHSVGARLITLFPRPVAARLIAPLCTLIFLCGISAASPKRIVSIAPSFTEILYAIGAGNEVVGTTLYCDYPPQALKTVKIGDVLNPNVEKIISLKPDLVLCGDWKWNVPEKLRAAGITVVEIKDAQNLQDIFHRFVTIGEEVGHEKEATALVVSMKHQLEQIRLKSAARPERTAYMEIDAGNWTIGGASYLNEILKVLHVQNIFGDREEPYLTVTMESIVARDPDMLLSLSRTKKDYESLSAWQTLRPVQSGRIIDKDRISWFSITHQGSRLVQGIQQLADAIDEVYANR
jgi:iron complex transport system substrate-binding protein